MKVALEASSLFFKNYTGIPFYCYNLYQGLSQLTDIDTVLAFRLKKKYTTHTHFHKDILQNPHYWHWQNLMFPRIRTNVVHSLHTPFLNKPGSLKVATVHDLAVHLPQHEGLTLATPYFKKKRLALFKSFHKHADCIITVSQATKRDFLKFFEFPEEKIHVVPLAPSLNFSKGKQDNAVLKDLGLREKSYFIAMGGVS
ncbi:MAG: glycosyltransferase, partial [Bacteroidota bacterium]